MENIYFVIIWFLTPIICLILLKSNSTSILTPNLINISIFFFMLFAYIGILPLYFGWDEYRFNLGINNQDIIFTMLIFSSLAILVFLFIFVLVNKLMNKDKEFSLKETHRVYKRNIIHVIIFGYICVIVFILYLLQLNSIPILEVLKGSASNNVSSSRSDATNAFSGNLHYYRLFFEYGLLFVYFTIISQYILLRERYLIHQLLIFTPIVIFTLVYSTEKSPLIWFLAGVILVVYITKGKIIKIKTVLHFTIISLISLFIFYTFFMGVSWTNPIAVLESIASRTFSGQLVPAYNYLIIFPDVIDYLQGKSFPNPGGIFPFEHYVLVVEVRNIMNASLSSMGIIGTAPTAFWGEGYANFGVIGIIASGIYIALFFGITQKIFNSLNKHPITISLYVSIILLYKNFALTGVSMFLFNINIIFLVLVYIVLVIMNRSKKYEY